MTKFVEKISNEEKFVKFYLLRFSEGDTESDKSRRTAMTTVIFERKPCPSPANVDALNLRQASEEVMYSHVA